MYMQVSVLVSMYVCMYVRMYVRMYNVYSSICGACVRTIMLLSTVT